MKQKVVIVTGAAKGIGREIALSYGKRHYKVVVVDIDREEGEAVTKKINANGGQAIYINTDVAVPEQIKELFQKIKENFGQLHILINNAGVSKWVSPYELSVDDWDEIININLRSVFLCSREAARMMKDGGGGSIVNISSTRALMSEPNSEAYAASKGGILALTHALAASLSIDNIKVNAISPGWIETGDYQELREIDHKQHFSARVGKPSDIANACLYITAEENDFITGANLVIDGGMTKKMIYEE
ncbi:SDR family oxidoreductase [Anaerobacillus sp. CMMVII]|uniref:SDR family NAD(P)-dependent oxidoreductase n=1 Tax=Anaerobacillus sp. CMMVII TaxID=2755588 RepID=UPI0021B7954F|nr:glucose 1-dehydrogenase [Anaerobacillus sp. CMMVII]MCT8138780.1 SDR family oxidoreductase [Anaerobacillus sp. CMMVII]